MYVTSKHLLDQYGIILCIYVSLRSTSSLSSTSSPQIYVTDICVQFSNICSFSNCKIGVQFSNLWPFLSFTNRRSLTSLTYELALTNKLAIDLRIPLYRTAIWDNDVSWCRLSLDADLRIQYINVDVVINVVNHVSYVGCYKGWWDTDCTNPCPVNCISGHCYPGNGSCVWGCNPDNCLSDICDTVTGVCTDGCKIGLDGDSCDRGKFGIFPQ